LIVLGIVSVYAQQDSAVQEDYSEDSTLFDEDFDEDYEAEDESSARSFVAPDTFKVQPRYFDESIIEELREDPDFDYQAEPTVAESLWDRFWRWIGEFVSQMLNGMVSTDWGRVLLYVGLLVVLIVIAMALLKVDAFRVLFKGADVASRVGVFHEDIHVMDFEELIKDAVAKEDFRNAVRLVFLYSLKLLSDQQHIQWQPGKTNHDYLDELKTNELRPGLGELSFYFDYAWYGGFDISRIQFGRVQEIFINWKGQIR
jgi:hypothetical protein